MVESYTTLNDLAHVIELSVAPVFLLAGIAGFLNVMAGRLGRIIDRARQVERKMQQLSSKQVESPPKFELQLLWRRVKITHWSIALCTVAGLLVCALIAGLFIGGFWNLAIDAFIVGCFVLALLMLIAALCLFLKEIQLATHTLRSGGEWIIDKD